MHRAMWKKRWKTLNQLVIMSKYKKIMEELRGRIDRIVYEKAEKEEKEKMLKVFPMR